LVGGRTYGPFQDSAQDNGGDRMADGEIGRAVDPNFDEVTVLICDLVNLKDARLVSQRRVDGDLSARL
jgi:hypothetical protein